MCHPDGLKPGTPEYRVDWFKRRHAQMEARARESDEKVDALTARLKAVEGLLACYRVGKQPSETLFAKLERTKRRLEELGVET